MGHFQAQSLLRSKRTITSRDHFGPGLARQGLAHRHANRETRLLVRWQIGECPSLLYCAWWQEFCKVDHCRLGVQLQVLDRLHIGRESGYARASVRHRWMGARLACQSHGGSYWPREIGQSCTFPLLEQGRKLERGTIRYHFGQVRRQRTHRCWFNQNTWSQGRPEDVAFRRVVLDLRASKAFRKRE